MKTSTLSVIATAVSIASASPAIAAGDPAAGEQLAKQYCARCHDISAGGAFKKYPPSFASIAVYRSEEQIYGRIVFPDMHVGSPMPEFFQNLFLKQESINDLVAYIMSLEKK
jgi:mono/diheme cytochrome c family protein